MTRNVHSTDNAPQAIGAYSQAVSAEGKFLFLSGQIPLRPDMTLVEGDVRQQAEQVMKNIDAVLKAAGLTKENVVKCTIFLSSMDYFGTVNEVYGAYFDHEPPARSAVAVQTLPKNVNVEIETIAVY